MSELLINAGPLRFVARLEDARAPRTCAAFRALLPFHNRLVQARWSGEAAWVPLGELELDVPAENQTSYPSRGDVLYHPADQSETELLLVYGSCRFASRVGQLAGNHFLTITEGLAQLPELGRLVLWEGAQPLAITRLER